MGKFADFIICVLGAVSLASCVGYTEKEPTVLAENGVIHRFFDTSPISPSGKYVALFRMPYENKTPKPSDAGDVIVIDVQFYCVNFPR